MKNIRHALIATTISAGILIFSACGDAGEPRVWTETFISPPAPIEISERVVSLSDRLALTEGGALWSWGENYQGYDMHPRVIMENIVAAHGNRYTKIAVDSQGTLLTWIRSRPAAGQYSTRLELDVDNNALIALTTGCAYSPRNFIITADDRLWSFGSNFHGALGDRTYTLVRVNQEIRRNPVKIIDNVVAVCGNGYAGNHIMAITSDGQLWGWGHNYRGFVIGSSDVTEQIFDRPTFIMHDVIAVSAGHNRTFAIRGDNTLWAWGMNLHGELGLGEGAPAEQRVPVQIMEDMGDIIAVSAGFQHTLMITADNTLWAWGVNDLGVLGDGTTDSRLYPVRIMENVVYAFAGIDHSMAITADGNVWAWGENSRGQLAMGTNRGELENERGAIWLRPVKVFEYVLLTD